MRLRTTILLALLAIPAAADDVRAKVDEFIKECTGEQNWEKKQKLLNALRRTAGSAKVFLEAVAAREDLEQSSWNLASAAQPLLDQKRDEIEAPVKELLKSPDPKQARFAILVVQHAGLTGALAGELLALAASPNSDAAGSASMALSSSRDSRVVALLITESAAAGDRGVRGLRMLASTGAPAGLEKLRAVVGDAKEPEDRRAEALSGLNRQPAPADVALAKSVLAEKLERLEDPAINLLINARATIPAADLKALRRKGDEWRESMIDKLLSLAGDEEGAKACLRRAHGGSEWDRVEWYAWAGRSGIQEIGAKMVKELGEETNDDVRMGILIGIGECGDPACADILAKYLTHPQKGNQAMKALAMLARRTPAAMDAVLDKMAEVTGTSMCGIDSFPYSYLEGATGANRAQLFDGYLRLLVRVNDRPRLREATLRTLSEMARPEFDWSEDALERWTAWWKVNRETFEKSPPKPR
ncbi:MAG: HEAT repeat domain-containing protein [Planctomycetota bacterium]